MTEKSYLSKLSFWLLLAGKSDYKDITRDYREIFECQKAEGKTDDEIILELGAPKIVAKSICKEVPSNFSLLLYPLTLILLYAYVGLLVFKHSSFWVYYGLTPLFPFIIIALNKRKNTFKSLTQKPIFFPSHLLVLVNLCFAFYALIKFYSIIYLLPKAGTVVNTVYLHGYDTVLILFLIIAPLILFIPIVCYSSYSLPVLCLGTLFVYIFGYVNDFFMHANFEVISYRQDMEFFNKQFNYSVLAYSVLYIALFLVIYFMNRKKLKNIISSFEEV